MNDLLFCLNSVKEQMFAKRSMMFYDIKNVRNNIL
jgi:hypothetical protein